MHAIIRDLQLAYISDSMEFLAQCSILVCFLHSDKIRVSLILNYLFMRIVIDSLSMVLVEQVLQSSERRASLVCEATWLYLFYDLFDHKDKSPEYIERVQTSVIGSLVILCLSHNYSL